MGHEHFGSADDAWGNTPSDELARRMFATGQVDAVHVYANIITVDLAEGPRLGGPADIVRDLYQYWKPGVEPPSFEDLQAEEAAAAAPSGDGGATVTRRLSEAAKRVPAHLLERSRLGPRALERQEQLTADPTSGAALGAGFGARPRSCL